MIKTLIVDDSALIREKVIGFLEKEDSIDVVAQADSGKNAIQILKQIDVDAIVMDINMPGIDGITTMQAILDKIDIPIIIFSSFTKDNLSLTYEALELGAFDVIHKPHGIKGYSFNEATSELVAALKLSGNTENDSFLRARSSNESLVRGLVLIGMSTGGPKTIRDIIPYVKPSPFYSFVIVQHMPESFIPSFAQRMNNYAQMPCLLAEDQMVLMPGNIYLAPGGVNTEIKNLNNGIGFEMSPPKEGQLFTPSIDETFKSAANIFGRNSLAIVLTGMGNDGAAGSCKINKNGGQVWVESEESAIVYGMPKETLLSVPKAKVLKASDFAKEINKIVQKESKAA